MIESTSVLPKTFYDFSLGKAETFLDQFAEHVVNFATLQVSKKLKGISQSIFKALNSHLTLVLGLVE
jgi:hypothetical protein